jgi:transcriptional regulator with XRE-family HTH domain
MQDSNAPIERRPPSPIAEHTINHAPGAEIRRLREEKGIRPVDVQRISETIKTRKNCSDFGISHATLNDIENEHSVPNVRKMFSLAASLGVSLDSILALYGAAPADVKQFYDGASETADVHAIKVPFEVPFDTPFDARRTSPVGAEARKWPTLPDVVRDRVSPSRYGYAWIGTEDTAMRGLIPPGSFIEVDRSQNIVVAATWSTVRDRPIYFCWTRDGHRCAWCEESEGELILIPDPASQTPVRFYKAPREARIIGRVINAWVPFVRADVA